MTEQASWYKDAIIYQLRVRSFYDSDGDGIGDLAGLTRKLDYLRDLGVTAIWMLPLYPSPMRDDGYDIADYTTVHPAIGNLDDFQRLLDEAHARDLKIITELVLNHTSDQHPWFQRARRSPPGSRYRDYYVWSDDPQRYAQARIIFQDFETSNWTWDPVAKAHYWHRFFAHQPDLNFDNPEVHDEMLAVVDRWFSMGVDGMRLDAVPYLYEREGTTCENLPETHGFLRKLRDHVDRKFPNKMLLAEANQWPEDAVAYFGQGDECHMAFHFPIMPRLFMSVRMEDSYPIIDILEQTPNIPANCQWATFLRNHDELTLEMVTEEERDYMIQRYAGDRQARINLGIRRRLAPLMQNDRRSIELMNVLLFALPGTPVVYYGDEIGMGDNAYLGDRNGVRTPMQWSPDRNGGFSVANPHQLILPTILDPEYHFETINVEVQQRNPSSLLWWMKRALAVRKQHPAFGRGSLHMLAPENRKVLAFLRRHGDETLLVVANLSRFPQYVELDLSEFKGVKPLELFGNVPFPIVGEGPYLLTLGGHDALWLSLSASAAQGLRAAAAASHDFSPLHVTLEASASMRLSPGSPLEQAFARYIPARRWFRSKTRHVNGTRLLDAVPLPPHAAELYLGIVEVLFSEGEPELYALPIARRLQESEPTGALLAVRRDAEPLPREWWCDASSDGRVAEVLAALAWNELRFRGASVKLQGVRVDGGGEYKELPAKALGAEQSNTSYVLGQEFIGKLVRKVEEGSSLEIEVLEHLRKAPGSPHVPRLFARIELEYARDRKATLWMTQSYIANEGDAWQVSIDAVQRFYERVLTSSGRVVSDEERAPLLHLASRKPSPQAEALLGEYLPLARLLGQRTAELHLALAHQGAEPAFVPQPFTALSKRSYYQSLRNLSARAFDKLKAATLPDLVVPLAERVLEQRRAVRSRLDRVLMRPLAGSTIRVHGDFHLGQVLYTGRDFYIIDFEGEPARARAERQRRRSPMADVAGMLRSFHYAAYGVLTGELPGSQVRPEDRAVLEPWASFFYTQASAAFLGTYLGTLSASGLLPQSEAELAFLLDVHLLEKALYELVYELNNRPRWVELPLRGILGVLDAPQPAE